MLQNKISWFRNALKIPNPHLKSYNTVSQPYQLWVGFFFRCEWNRENLRGLYPKLLLLLLWAKAMREQYFRISAQTCKTLLFNRLNYLLHRDRLCHSVLWTRIFSMTHLCVSRCLSLPINITAKHHLFIFISPTPLPLQPSHISKERLHLLPQFPGAWGNGCPLFLHSNWPCCFCAKSCFASFLAETRELCNISASPACPLSTLSLSSFKDEPLIASDVHLKKCLALWINWWVALLKAKFPLFFLSPRTLPATVSNRTYINTHIHTYTHSRLHGRRLKHNAYPRRLEKGRCIIQWNYLPHRLTTE